MLMQYIAGAAVKCVQGNVCDTGLPTVGASSSALKVVVQIVLGIVGSLTVIIIIVNSIRLSASQGNPQEATKARQGIIYALVGLVLAISAEIIVNFVITTI